MTNVEIMAGTLTANKEERVVSGLLLPFGVVGQTTIGRFSVDRGVFEIPEDYSVLNANLDHDNKQPIASTLTLTETDQGIFGSWKVAKSPEGDTLLAAKANDPEARRQLSIEVDKVRIKDGKATAGRIFGAAFVKEGAFVGATLLAAIAPDTQDVPEVDPEANADPAEPTTTTEKSVDEYTDEAGVKHTRTVTTVTVVDGPSTTITTTTEITDPTNPEEEEAAPVATATLNAAKPMEASASTVYDAIRAVSSNVGAGEAQTLLAALADVKTSGSGQLGTNAIQPAWLGEVWSNKDYVRKFWPLVKNGTVVAQTEKGFTLDDADPIIAAWSGNKTAVPTGNGTTSPASGVFQRWAAAVDIAREFFDLADGGPVIEAFLHRFVNDYSKVTDKWALQQLVTGAGAAKAAGTYPSGYSSSIGKIIDGIDQVNASDVDATFVVAAPDVYRDLMFTPFEQIPQFISLSASTQGEGTADGVTVVRDKFGILAAGQVLVGAHDAAHLNEMAGGSPLQIDALNLANGGVDKAVHGYSQYMTEYAKGLLLIGVAA